MISVVVGRGKIALSVGVLHVPPVLVHEYLIGDKVPNRVKDVFVVCSDTRIVLASPHVQRNTLPTRGLY